METTMTATRIDRGSTATTTIYSVGGDLVFERTFDAPREQVWKAFTDPEIVPHWWGPHGTTTTVVEMDVRPGGKWRYVSHAGDREDVAFYGEYLEIDPPKGYKWTFMFDVEGVGPQGGPGDVHLRGRRGEDQGHVDRAHGLGRDARRSPRERHGRGSRRDLGPPRGPACQELTGPSRPGARFRGSPGLFMSGTPDVVRRAAPAVAAGRERAPADR